MDILVSPQIERLIRDALDEDIGAGDLATMATIRAEAQGKGRFRAKKDGVVAGLVLLDRIFYFIDPKVKVRLMTKDGSQVKDGTVVAEAEGPVRALLLAERTALNFLQRLSGTATLTCKYVDAVKGFSCKVLDTRKTTPGLRTLEKYAVRMGGGTNHRIGLHGQSGSRGWKSKTGPRSHRRRGGRDHARQHDACPDGGGGPFGQQAGVGRSVRRNHAGYDTASRRDRRRFHLIRCPHPFGSGG